jgi:hypothetical protein
MEGQVQQGEYRADRIGLGFESDATMLLATISCSEYALSLTSTII